MSIFSTFYTFSLFSHLLTAFLFTACSLPALCQCSSCFLSLFTNLLIIHCSKLSLITHSFSTSPSLLTHSMRIAHKLTAHFTFTHRSSLVLNIHSQSVHSLLIHLHHCSFTCCSYTLCSFAHCSHALITQLLLKLTFAYKLTHSCLCTSALPTHTVLLHVLNYSLISRTFFFFSLDHCFSFTALQITV